MTSLRSQRGSVMIFALIFAIIICGCCGSYLSSVGNELRMTRRSFNHGRAMALAEAGVELALWRCNSGRLDESDGWTFSADGNSLMRVYTSSDLSVLANLGAGGSGKIYLRIDDVYSDTPSIISMGRITEPNGVVTKQVRVELNKNTTS